MSVDALTNLKKTTSASPRIDLAALRVACGVFGGIGPAFYQLSIKPLDTNLPSPRGVARPAVDAVGVAFASAFGAATGSATFADWSLTTPAGETIGHIDQARFYREFDLRFPGPRFGPRGISSIWIPPERRVASRRFEDTEAASIAALLDLAPLVVKLGLRAQQPLFDALSAKLSAALVALAAVRI